ncbi:MAG: hypothetical protein M1829_000280 [Trizodia sp. TS-e1964]|nr:MAG: hypothetical protein M1829_000280 [Trizodia sp. TS-e1964]
MSELRDLKAACMALIAETTAHRVGFARLSGDADEVPFSEREAALLALYQRLEELTVERSMLRALERRRKTSASTTTPPPTISPEVIEDAKVQALEAQARYSLRQQVIESVVMTDPILQAVHTAKNEELRRRIQTRDSLSVVHTQIASRLSGALAQLSIKEKEGILLSRENVALAGTLMELAKEVGGYNKSDIADEEVRQSIEGIEQAMNVARSRWHMMKNVISAVIVGSGVDWARNVQYRTWVMEGEEDEGEE